MMKYFLILILFTQPLFSAELLINEIACNTESDWVELKLVSQNSQQESLRIDNLFVTMYYGTNEKLSNSPVTLYSYNRDETSYDDRFAVVHLTEPEDTDENDITGDVNNNGYLDLYCNNYYNSLWNSDAVVSIDTDDDPSNGGIIDFAAYSSCDGKINSTIENYINSAISLNQWNSCTAENIQECLVDIGDSGLKSYMSICRINSSDTNTKQDFAVSSFQTPGRDNLLSINKAGRKIFKVLKKRISISKKIYLQ